jgi:CheY-like chemotaxis protein
MKKLIEWLVTVEDLARRFYTEAETYFKSDREFSGLLHDLAEDEAWHVHVMKRAAEYAADGTVPPAAIKLDNATKARIEAPLQEGRREWETDLLSKEKLLSCMVATEYSEWNVIFLYVVSTLKEYDREFADAASKIHQHKKHLERYLASIPEGGAYLDTVQRLPAVWQEKILIVEDHQALREFLRDILSPEGAVSTATNGKEGLELVTEQRFDIILSDVQMPVLDGIDFYRRALLHDAGLKERFLFITADPTREHLAFFKQNNLRHVLKPVPIGELQKAVHTIIRRTRTAPG